MGQAYIEELRWLEGEIAKLKGRVANLDEQQKAWRDAIAEQRQKNEMLKNSLANTDSELAKAQEAARMEGARQEKAEEDAAREVATKEEELVKRQREKGQLKQQLEEAKLQIAPILKEIVDLNSEIEQLRQDNEMRRKSLNDSEVLPKEVESLRERLERAMRLKPGLLQKIRFVEELFTELGESGSSDRSRLLAKYKKLAKELEAIKYEQLGG